MFSYVLVVSRRKVYSVHTSADVHELMEGHVMAFERLGGLAEECKYDNQRSVVIGREGGLPIWNLRFADWVRPRPRPAPASQGRLRAEACGASGSGLDLR